MSRVRREKPHSVTVAASAVDADGNRTYVICTLTILLLIFFSIEILHFFRGGSSSSFGSLLRGETRATRQCPPPPSIDYIEIGTSNFLTIIGANTELTRNPGWFQELLHGVSVDAMKVYIDQLPEIPQAAMKLNFAVSGMLVHPETLPTYFISPEDLITYKLPEYLKGCNRVGQPHPLAIAEAAKVKMPQLVQHKEVPVISVPELMEYAGACRISALKIDVEGLDAELILSYVDFLWRNPQCRADIVMFEERNPDGNETNPYDAVKAALRGVGYAPGFNKLGVFGVPDRDDRYFWSSARDMRFPAARAQLQRGDKSAPHGLDQEAAIKMFKNGAGGTEEGMPDYSAEEADDLFAKVCSRPLPPPHPDMAHIQGRTPRSAYWLNWILSEII
jgi:hypothetical protein